MLEDKYRHTVLVVPHGFQKAYERGFCKALVYNGVDVVLASSDGTDPVLGTAGVRLVNIRGSQNPNRPSLAKALNLIRYHVRLWILALTRGRAVIHVIGVFRFPIFMGVLEGMLFRLVARRYVLTVHNILPHDRHTLWNRLLYRWIYALPHVLVVHTERMRRELVGDYGVAASRVIVMQHGCEIENLSGYTESPIIFRESPAIRLLFFGIIAPYKGLDILLGALRMLPAQFELRIAGRCVDTRLREWLKEEVREASKTHRIEWHDGYVPEEFARESMRWADVVVLPYRHIDQSGVPFYAFSHGVPVVASDVGEFSSLIVPSVGECCRPEDPESLAQAITNLAARRDQLSRESIMGYSKKFDWNVTVRALEEAYAFVFAN